MKINRKHEEEVELDITAFMNLMIVLVPVLLMSMVFKSITVLELNIPDLSGGSSSKAEKNKQLELVVREDEFRVYYPTGVLIKTIPPQEEEIDGQLVKSLDYQTLSNTLKEVKRKLDARKIDKRDILLLTDNKVNYQVLVTTMDTVRAYKTVVATSLIEAELFPEISLGDAPKQKGGK